MAGDIEVIWVRQKQKYFFKQDWTGQIRLIRFNKSRFSRLRATTDQRLAEADGASAPSGSHLRNELNCSHPWDDESTNPNCGNAPGAAASRSRARALSSSIWRT